MKIIPASDSSLLVVLGNDVLIDLHHRVIALFRGLQAQRDTRIRNLHPGYASILIDFDPLRLSHEELKAHVQQIASASRFEQPDTANIISIPVCYDSEFGPDLADVAGHAKLSTAEVTRLHSSATYLVYFLGFSPGFAYLGGLPDVLKVPRLTTPRGHVAAGTIGIAGAQTGIYPVDSPGGWRLIGRTPLRMFDPAATPPTRLQPGDQVSFSPIDRATFNRIESNNGSKRIHTD